MAVADGESGANCNDIKMRVFYTNFLYVAFSRVVFLPIVFGPRPLLYSTLKGLSGQIREHYVIWHMNRSRFINFFFLSFIFNWQYNTA
jgi:hypothetical protein